MQATPSTPQPAVTGAFNDQRLPSKLPEAFAMGKPVVLSRSHLGLRAEHRRHAFVLDDATSAPIADAVRTILQDPALKVRLASGARDFYQVALRERGEHLHSFLCALANRQGAESRSPKADAPAASVATSLDDHPVPRAGDRTPRDTGIIQTLNRVQGQP